MYLSVIIPTRNRAKELYRTLESLTNQTLPQKEFEVIVVDNGSADTTKQVAMDFMNRINNLSYYFEEIPGLHAGRHRGLREAKTDILVYCDDDIVAFPTWLEGIKESFEDQSTVVVGGKDLPYFESVPPAWLLNMWKKKRKDGHILGYLSLLDLGDTKKEIDPYYVFGCNLSIRKNVLLEAGGFHPDGMPQELIRFRGDGESYISEHISKKGYKVVYNPKASVYHLVSNNRMTLKYFCQRSFNQGISDSYTAVRKTSSNRELSYKMPQKDDNAHSVHFNASIRSKLAVIKKFIQDPKGFYFNKKIGSAYGEGYAFHQAEVSRNPRLVEWILKNDYLDYQNHKAYYDAI